jgi:hypothetical protein
MQGAKELQGGNVCAKWRAAIIASGEEGNQDQVDFQAQAQGRWIN